MHNLPFSLEPSLIYLLDTNVLVDANRDYYPMRRVPEFWEWLLYVGKENLVKIPHEIYVEVKDGNDELAQWMKETETEKALLLNEEIDPETVTRVVNEGYANDLDDVELEKLGNDPFLIAYALGDVDHRCVVTTEVSKPKRTRANRHIPDVCAGLHVQCCNTYKFIDKLNFSTQWKSNLELPSTLAAVDGE